MGRLLVLRPEPGASATVERARQYGLDAIAVPLFELVAVAWEAPAPDRFDGLLLTSANAVRLSGDRLRLFSDLRVYAVGKATADAAIEAGLDVAMIGDAGVDRLLQSAKPGLRLLHLCGFDRRHPAAPRQEIRPIIVYRSTPANPRDFACIAGDMALIHSPEAGRRFAELATDRKEIAILAISKQAARAAGKGWAIVEAVSQPSDDALLALAASLCNNLAP